MLDTKSFNGSSPKIDIGSFNGHLLIEVSDAMLTDTIAGKEVALTGAQTMQLVQADYSGGQVQFDINFWTTLASRYAFYLIQQEGVATKQAILRANTEVGKHLTGIDLITTERQDLKVASSANAAAIYELATLAVSHVALSNGFASAVDFADVVFADIEDGVLDGSNSSGNPIGVQVPLLMSLALSQSVSAIFNEAPFLVGSLQESQFTDLKQSFENPISAIFTDLPNVGSDFNPPALQIEGIFNGSVITGPTEVTVTAIDQETGILSLFATVDDELVQDNEPLVDQLRFTLNGVEGESLVVKITAKDYAGNPQQETLIVSVASSAPDIQMFWDDVELNDGDNMGGAFVFRAVANDPNPIVNLEVIVSNLELNQSLDDFNPADDIYETFMNTPAFISGFEPMQIQVVAEDIFGDESVRTISVEVHNEGPSVTFDIPGDNRHYSGDQPLVFTISSVFPIDVATITIEGIQSTVLVDDTPLDGFENFTDTFVTASVTNPWPEGPVTITVVAEDAAGIETTTLFEGNINNIVFENTYNLRFDKGVFFNDYRESYFMMAAELYDDNKPELVTFGHYLFDGLKAPIYTHYTEDYSERFGNWSLHQISPLEPPNTDKRKWDMRASSKYRKPQSGAICDIDGDGHDDVIVTRPWLSHPDFPSSNHDGGISVHYGPNNSNGDFAHVDVIFNPEPLGDYERFGYMVSCSDFNDDGIDDILVGSIDSPTWPQFEDNRVWITYGNLDRNAVESGPMKRFSQPDIVPFRVRFPVAIGDFDGDGFQDFNCSTRRCG